MWQKWQNYGYVYFILVEQERSLGLHVKAEQIQTFIIFDLWGRSSCKALQVQLKLQLDNFTLLHLKTLVIVCHQRGSPSFSCSSAALKQFSYLAQTQWTKWLGAAALCCWRNNVIGTFIWHKINMKQFTSEKVSSAAVIALEYLQKYFILIGQVIYNARKVWFPGDKLNIPKNKYPHYIILWKTIKNDTSDSIFVMETPSAWAEMLHEAAEMWANRLTLWPPVVGC